MGKIYMQRKEYKWMKRYMACGTLIMCYAVSSNLLADQAPAVVQDSHSPTVRLESVFL
jgi:hypothetical protein